MNPFILFQSGFNDRCGFLPGMPGMMMPFGDCAPLLWVDNVRWGSVDLDGEGPDRELFPIDIEGIEVYRPSAVPMEFSGFDSACGAVVVWTKRAP